MATGIDTQGIQAFRNRYYGQVATRNVIPTDFQSSNKEQGSKSGHIARDHIVGIQVVWPNFWVDTNGVEQVTGTNPAWTTTIEYPAGTRTQIPIGGQATGQSGAPLVFTDIKPVSIPPGKEFWIKGKRSDPSGGIIFCYAPFKKSTAIHADALTFGTTVADETMSATATNNDANNMYAPIAILGYTRSGSVIVFGDSLAAGQNDTADASGDSGLCRFIGGSLAYINLGRPSDRCDWFVAGSAIRRSLAAYCTDILLEYGTNDAGAAAQTAAQVITTRTSAGTLLKSAYPNKRLWLGTLLPRASSNANTAPDAINAVRIAINDAARLVPAPYDGCIDFADAFENSRNGGLYGNNAWLDANSGFIHPNQTGYLGALATGFITPSSFRL